jgi:hypothetical protein
MTNTKKSIYKEQREWNDLLSEKKAYIKRKQEEEDANRLLEEFQYWRDVNREDNDPTD